MRAEPDGEVIGHLAEGAQVFILGESVLQDDIIWYQVRMPDDTMGWVVGDYVVFRESSFVVNSRRTTKVQNLDAKILKNLSYSGNFRCIWGNKMV